MNILISGVGGPTPRSISRSIKISRYNQKSKLFGTDINPYVHGLYESKLYEKNILVPSARNEKYWDTIKAFVQENDIKFDSIKNHETLQKGKKIKKINILFNKIEKND